MNGDLKQRDLNDLSTEVKAIQDITFQAKESKAISSSDREMGELTIELLESYIIG